MKKLVAAGRASAQLPVLERLRALERLEPLAVGDVEELLRLTDRGHPYEDYDWATDVVRRVAPIEFWLDVAPRTPGFLVDQVEALLAGRLVTALSEALFSAPSASHLERLHHHLAISPPIRLPEGAWPRVLQLATHDDPAVRVAAAVLALRHKQISPAVTVALAELLTGEIGPGPDCDPDSYRCDVLVDIAACGMRLAALGPHIERLLGADSKWIVASAAEAAGGLGEPSLASALDAAESQTASDDETIGVVRARIRFARWRLGARLSILDDALDDAGNSVLYQPHVMAAFRRAEPDDRLLAGLVRAAERPYWIAAAFHVLGEIGARAADALDRVPPPDVSDSFALIEYYDARWRTGRMDADALADALQPLLATDFRAWGPYVKAATFSPLWIDTLRAAVRSDEHEALSNLRRIPPVGARFLPDLIAAGKDDIVTSLWHSLPPETFWAHVGDASGS